MARATIVWGYYEGDPENPILSSVPVPSYERQDPDHLNHRPFTPELRRMWGRETAIQKMRWTEDGWLRMDGEGLSQFHS